MPILQNLQVPTGNILVIEGEGGKLECLSLGDYGQESNIKADFLNLSKELDGVPNGQVMPLEEKWVLTVSTQYGCSMGCTFCDVPRVGRGRNASVEDLTSQILAALTLHPEVECTKRLNVHYARMGEPTFNRNVLAHAKKLMKEVRPYIGRSHIHPVISTMMPKNNKFLVEFLEDWCEIKNDVYRGSAGLQFSINSTCNIQRDKMFGGSSLSLEDIANICKHISEPVGRKYALNFALFDDTIVDAERLASLFDPRKFMVKITPMHVTNSCEENNIVTSDGYEDYTPYKAIEADLKASGFDVLVFVPSLEEDQGRITCGNAILSGTLPLCEYKVIQMD